MGRARSVLGTVVFLFAAPGVVAGLVPFLLNHWRFAPALLGLEPLRWLGLVLMIPAALLLLDAFARFASISVSTCCHALAGLRTNTSRRFACAAAASCSRRRRCSASRLRVSSRRRADALSAAASSSRVRPCACSGWIIRILCIVVLLKDRQVCMIEPKETEGR